MTCEAVRHRDTEGVTLSPCTLLFAGIDLENIVYYKDCTHYFVMTAKKQSLLDKGVIINVCISWLRCPVFPFMTQQVQEQMLSCGELSKGWGRRERTTTRHFPPPCWV